MTNTQNATIALRHPGHGTYTADVRILNRAIEATMYRSIALLRRQACGHCGFGDFDFEDTTPLDDLSRIEVLIAWIDSGNHTF